MNLYVDNVIGVDDASHGASAGTPIKTLPYVFSVPGFASGTTIYIKATGVEYQLATGHRVLDFYDKGFSELRLTDTLLTPAQAGQL